MPTYSYDDTLPTEMDDVRARLGVTDISRSAASALISDEHIISVIAAQGSIGRAVAYLARELALRFAQQIGRVTLPNGLSVAWPDRVAAWWALATDSTATNAASGGVVSGQLTTIAPIGPPSDGPDANDPRYRGSPYRSRRR